MSDLTKDWLKVKYSYHCATHGWWDAKLESGCHECVIQLRRALKSAQEDAERYRWLRDVGDATWNPISKRGITAAECDAAIDEARKREG